jgi:voltage-gated potassium channel
MTTLGSDAANVYVTLTAKQLRPELHVVAIAQDERSRSKLEAAGADEVILPYVIGGTWMVQALLSPAVADFVRMATGANPLNFYMEEQRVAASSPLAGHALRELPIRRDLGVIVVAVRRADGSLVTNPPPEFVVGQDDTLVSVVQHENLAKLQQMAAGR